MQIQLFKIRNAWSFIVCVGVSVLWLWVACNSCVGIWTSRRHMMECTETISHFSGFLLEEAFSCLLHVSVPVTTSPCHDSELLQAKAPCGIIQFVAVLHRHGRLGSKLDSPSWKKLYGAFAHEMWKQILPLSMVAHRSSHPDCQNGVELESGMCPIAVSLRNAVQLTPFKLENILRLLAMYLTWACTRSFDSSTRSSWASKPPSCMSSVWIFTAASWFKHENMKLEKKTIVDRLDCRRCGYALSRSLPIRAKEIWLQHWWPWRQITNKCIIHWWKSQRGGPEKLAVPSHHCPGIVGADSWCLL